MANPGGGLCPAIEEAQDDRLMISSGYKKVKIYITTYAIEDKDRKISTSNETMERRQKQHESDKRFVCSICLNRPGYNNDCGKKFVKSCPICRNSYPCNYRNEKGIEIDVNCKGTPGLNKKTDQETKSKRNDRDLNTKNVQTSQTDLTQDLSLLKEVLTVFQTKKLDIKTNNSVIMKDKYVETESNTKIDLTAKLTMSRIFQLSIDDDNRTNENNFKIVNYNQPNNGKTSQLSIDLIKHKSSSIPQMKLEELKYSLKEKVKSKDAIEEVNRMFATVRRHDLSDAEEPNRPMVRSGPRVLPVVKTKTHHDANKRFSNCEVDTKTNKCPVTKIDPINNCKKNEDKTSTKTQNDLDNNHKEESDTEPSFCKCCQTNNMQLSGGDSFFKHECCYHKMMCEGRCEKCIYMLCCHYQKHNRIETGALVCECCRKVSNEKAHGCERENCEHF